MKLINWTKATTYYLDTEDGYFKKIIANNTWYKNNAWEQMDTESRDEKWEEIYVKVLIDELEQLLLHIQYSENKDLFDEI